MLSSGAAMAQLGPDLRPPGLSPNHPVDAYSADGSKKKHSDDWRHESGWELNASDIVFSAAKKRQLISEAPSTIHVITSADIAAHGWRTLAEILRHVPGIQTQTTISQFQSVMIRGLVGTENNNSRILWLQNGVPMNDVRDSGIWLDETYPVEMIKRIEVVLGPGSALYGSGAFQGVVNIFTKDPADINKYGEYRVAIQNNLTFKASAIAAYNSDDKDLGILIHAAGNTTQGPGLIGDYIYEDYSMIQGGANVGAGRDVNDLFYSAIDSNSDKHWYNVDFKLHYKFFKWSMGFTDIYAGADGSEAFPYISYDTDAANAGELDESKIYDHIAPMRAAFRFNRREFYTDFVFDSSIGDSLTFLGVVSYRLNQYRFKNYAGNSPRFLNADATSTAEPDAKADDSATSNISPLNKLNFSPLQQKIYGLAQLQWRIYDANELIAGIGLEYHNINSDSEFISVSNDNRNDSKIDYLTPSVFIQDEQKFWNDRIIITLGGRFDAYKVTSGQRDYAPSWRAAFLGKWADWITMRLSYGHAFKEPSLYQLYADTVDYIGVETLSPEKLENVELSFLFTPTYFMKIRLDGFATFIEDLIIVQYQKQYSNTFFGVDGRYSPTQNNKAQLYGFELSLNSSIGKHWNVYTHYNFLYSKIDSGNSTQDSSAAQNGKTSENTDAKITAKKFDRIPDDAMHRFKLGATFTNDRVSADMAFFLVAGTPKTDSNFSYRRDKGGYATPTYAILQPQVTVNVGANIGLMLQGSYAFSEGMTHSPTHKFYYEKEGVPASRYSVMFSLMYPFKNN